MKTLDEIRNEVLEDDLRQFDKRVAGVRKKVYNAIEAFGMTPGVMEFEHGVCARLHVCVQMTLGHLYIVPYLQVHSAYYITVNLLKLLNPYYAFPFW